MTPQQPPTFDLPESHCLLSGDKQPGVILCNKFSRDHRRVDTTPRGHGRRGATSVIRLLGGEVTTPLASSEWVSGQSRAAAGRRSHSEDLLAPRSHPRLRSNMRQSDMFLFPLQHIFFLFWGSLHPRLWGKIYGTFVLRWYCSISQK